MSEEQARTPKLRKLLLASGSPRRREILRKFGLPFETVNSHTEPSLTRFKLPAAAVKYSARLKAEEVAGRCPGRLVLGADTVVALGSRLLGKPAHMDEAQQMLRALSGHEHRVYTGVALVVGGGGVVRVVSQKVARTDVVFKQLSQETIEWYLGMDESLDKAGAYAIQGQGGNLIAGISGSYYNVMGLPIELVLQMLHDIGWLTQTHLNR